MMEIWLACASLPACFLLHFVLQRTGALDRFSSRQNAVAGLCAFNGIAFGLGSGSWYVLFCAVGFSHLYFHLYNYTETARRIRILTTLFQARDLKDYSDQEILSRRLERLSRMGSLREADGYYYTGGVVMMSAALVFRWLRRLFYPYSIES